MLLKFVLRILLISVFYPQKIKMRKRFCILFVFLLLLRGIPALGRDKNNALENTISGEALITEYYADKQDLNLVYIFTVSPEYFDRFTQFYADWLERLKAVDFNVLNEEDQVDYILLKRNILNDQYELEQRKKDWPLINYALPFENKIIQLQQQRRRGNTLNAINTASALQQILTDINNVKPIVQKQPLENDHLKKLAVKTVQELRKGLKSVYSFYNGYDPDFSWWMKTSYPDADSALSDYANWLSKQSVLHPDKALDSSGIIGNPEGKAAIERGLKAAMIPYTPEELVQIANKEYTWCEAEMIKASQQMGYGNDWKKALEKVKENHLPPGQQPQLINKLEEHAIHFVDSLDLVTIPPLAREAWRMVMLTPEEMRYASYFLGGPEIMVAYANEGQDYNTKMGIMRSGNYAFAHAEVFHELIPGHNLQFFMMNRYRSYREYFSSPFSVEGWAFYWEMLLWDKGYHSTPEEKVGALFWRMTRCARIVFSLNYHLNKWTPQQCINYLVDKVGLERFSAESEVRRSFTGGYGPLYQLAYMSGALQMYALHHEIVDSKKMTDKQFNDTFLHNGTIPIELFRALLIHQKLIPDFVTQWRFADN